MAQMTLAQLYGEWRNGDADDVEISTAAGTSHIDEVRLRREGDGEIEVVVVLADLPDIIGAPNAELIFQRTP